MTEQIAAEENLEDGISCPEITMEIEEVVSSSKSRVIRRFEYFFGLPQIHVQMFHLVDQEGALHLVEIYSEKTRIPHICKLSGHISVFFGISLCLSNQN